MAAIASVARVLYLGTDLPARDVGALAEVVVNAGCMVGPQDARGFSEAMVQVWKDGSLSDRLIERGLQRCRLFSWRAWPVRR